MKNTLVTLVIVILIIAIGAAIYFLMPHGTPAPAPEPVATSTDTSAMAPEAPATGRSVIGQSAGGRDIEAYRYGTGATEVMFVGGLHGGYDWNTSLLAYDLKSYLDAHPDAVPANESVTVIPVVNPDGLAKVVSVAGPFAASDVSASADAAAARYNGNGVDLNRNFDCDWQAKGVWQSTPVSGGTAAFSEPETKAVADYVSAHHPSAVVVWYSAAGGVYASNCHDGVLPETDALTKAYADASGYSANESFDFYATTGDMVNWLAKEQIPGISVLLTNHTDAEWDKNLAGVKAVLARYAK